MRKFGRSKSPDLSEITRLFEVLMEKGEGEEIKGKRNVCSKK